MLQLKKIDSKWFYVVSELVNKGSSYGILLILSYFLTSAQYAQITLFNSILTLAVVFVSLNLTRSYITRIYLDKTQSIKDNIETILSFLLLCGVVSLLAAFLLLRVDSVFNIASPLISAGIIVAVFMSGYDILQGLLVAAEAKIAYCVLSIIYSVSSVILSLGLYFLFPALGIWAFIGMKLFLALVTCLGATAYLIKKYQIRFHIDGKVLKPALCYSLPLILHSVSGFLLNYLDRFMINGFVGLSETALYSFAHNLAMILNIAAVAVNQGFLPKFYRLMEQQDYQRIDALITHNGLLLASLSVLYAFALDNVMFLFPAQYRQLQPVTFMLLFSYILYYGYVIFSNYLYYQKNTVLVFVNTLTAGLVNIALNYFLIQSSGYIGATIATLISYLVMYLLFYRSARKKFPKGVYSFAKMSVILFATALVIAVYFFIRPYLVVKLLYILCITVGITVFYFKKGRTNHG